MNIPGFGAEASLYNTEERYRAVMSEFTESVSPHSITAQFPLHRPPPIDCDSLECHQQGGYIVCHCG